MSAIDTHTIHTLCEKLRDERVVIGSFTRHGHHDGHSSGRSRPEHGLGLLIEQLLAGIEINGIRRGLDSLSTCAP
jgi:hypothetical protein